MMTSRIPWVAPDDPLHLPPRRTMSKPKEPADQYEVMKALEDCLRVLDTKRYALARAIEAVRQAMTAARKK